MINYLLVDDIPKVGRSLVSTHDLPPNYLILEDEPLLSYPLRPVCRSSASPYFSKRLWDLLYDSVRSNLDDAMEKEIYIPGIPAALLAFLTFKNKDTSFFHRPGKEEKHTVLSVTEAVLEQIILEHGQDSPFSDVRIEDAVDFVAKIYSNAHAVVKRRCERPNHSRRKYRRRLFARKNPGEYINLGSETNDEAENQIYIALFPWASKFAHDCEPNCWGEWDMQGKKMVYRTRIAVKEGTPLSFSYLSENIDDVEEGILTATAQRRKEALYSHKFFRCACDRCERQEDGDIGLSDFVTAKAVLRHLCRRGLNGLIMYMRDPEKNNTVENMAETSWSMKLCLGLYHCNPQFKGDHYDEEDQRKGLEMIRDVIHHFDNRPALLFSLLRSLADQGLEKFLTISSSPCLF